MSEEKRYYDKFMNANEAYKRTNEVIDKCNTTEIQNLKDHILDAIKAGNFSFTDRGVMSDLAKEYFKNKNYKITEITNKYFKYFYSYTISWEDKEK